MNLKELRKKYLGSHVQEKNLPAAFRIYTYAEENIIEWETGDECVYSATIHLDKTMRIKSISRLFGKTLVGDDATRVNYRPMRISIDDYDMLGDAIESIVTEAENETIAHSSTLGSLIDFMGNRYPIYLFSESHCLLGVVGSKKLGILADEERSIPVKQFQFSLELGQFIVNAYLLESAITEKWK